MTTTEQNPLDVNYYCYRCNLEYQNLKLSQQQSFGKGISVWFFNVPRKKSSTFNLLTFFPPIIKNSQEESFSVALWY